MMGLSIMPLLNWANQCHLSYLTIMRNHLHPMLVHVTWMPQPEKKVRDEALALAIEQPARAVPEPASGKARTVVLAAADTQGKIAAAEGASGAQLQDAGEMDGKNK
jgi:hypothetical protein